MFFVGFQESTPELYVCSYSTYRPATCLRTTYVVLRARGKGATLQRRHHTASSVEGRPQEVHSNSSTAATIAGAIPLLSAAISSTTTPAIKDSHFHTPPPLRITGFVQLTPYCVQVPLRSSSAISHAATRDALNRAAQPLTALVVAARPSSHPSTSIRARAELPPPRHVLWRPRVFWQRFLFQKQIPQSRAFFLVATSCRGDLSTSARKRRCCVHKKFSEECTLPVLDRQSEGRPPFEP
jgi:hypothetical protein